MYLSNTDDVNDVNIDNTSHTRQGITLSVTFNSSRSSSPSCSTLLVIDDNSNSNEITLNKSDIPSNSMLSSTQINHVQTTPSSPSSTLESSKDTHEQQRRRTSSIAKLLGGQPLNNQQYEEINQQIIDDQSSQNITTNNDNNADTEIQRSRSSITRTLLMNNERNDNASTTTPKSRPPSPSFSKDFEYLIRRELDIEHSPSTLNRNEGTPSIFQNRSSVRNTPTNSPSSSQSKLKRKRLNPKQTVSTPPPPPPPPPPTTTNKSSTNAPFTIRDPFELDCSQTSLNQTLNPASIHRSHHHQNDLYRFDASSHCHLQPHQNQQQYSLPMNSSTSNPASLTYHKFNIHSPSYAHYKIHNDRLSTTTCSSSSLSPSSSYNYCRYPVTAELALPIPVSPLSPNVSSPTFISYHTMPTSLQKNKTIHNRPDIYEIPMQRSHSTISTQSNESLSSLSSGHSVPLKKRLLHAYKNEQRPSSSL
ncbi:unnamed protein product [Rotaria magnacalcarata]|uniref:Uncharacterized protein n=4 Tax=Rotaria magnacalcarata TaxID=392030 RepID=A0A815KYZ8_9BILA|nr:unnamed protein product [Rotaria magnacalcarata]CAF1399742.1 unnamed protein product [Rotaria magnacalcarata]CAF3886239.1 unnamed protein product [Rotaria magnacalcarata]CAF4050001.1 unnamed protein product [Rotaria magnacalcarata]